MVRIYIYVFSSIRGPMSSWETPFFANLTSSFLNQCYVPSMVKIENKPTFLVEKEFECIKCKATFNFFSTFLCFLMHFWFKVKIKTDELGIKFMPNSSLGPNWNRMCRSHQRSSEVAKIYPQNYNPWGGQTDLLLSHFYF